MAVTTDEILSRGKGPQSESFMDDATGVENVNYDEVTNRGMPVNPKGVQDIVKPPSGPQTNVEHTIPVGEHQRARAPQKLTYAEMFQQLNPYKPPTQEELESERKKQKREAIFAAIGDGISALSNLYFTSQYAPNAYDPREGMAPSSKARFDRLKKEREDNQRLYMDGYLRAMKMDADAERGERSWLHTIERERLEDRYKNAAEQRAQAKADRDAAMAQLRMDLMQGRIDQQDAAAEAKRIEADYAEAYWQSRIGKNNYRPPIGSGKAKEYPWYDREGNLHYASSYEAMRQNALNHGTWSEGTQTLISVKETKGSMGNVKDSVSQASTKPAKGHSVRPQDDNKWKNASQITY